MSIALRVKTAWVGVGEEFGVEENIEKRHEFIHSFSLQ